MDKKEGTFSRRKVMFWFATLSTFYIIVFSLFSAYLGLGTFGSQYSFSFALLISYTTISMALFTFFRIFIIRNRKNLINKGIVQLSVMWFIALMFIGVGVSLPAHYSVLNSFNAESALVLAVVAATSFWIIETTTKTTVDIFTDGEIKD